MNRNKHLEFAARYRAFGFLIITTLGGWIIAKFEHPMLIAFLGAGIAVYALSALVGMWFENKAHARGRINGRANVSVRCGHYIDAILLFLVGIFVITFLWNGCYEAARGIRIGIEKPASYYIKLADYDKGVPQKVAIIFSMYIQNTSRNYAAGYTNLKLSNIGNSFAWKWEWDFGMDPAKIKTYPGDSTYLLPPYPSPLIHLQPKMVFTVGHSDRKRFIRELSTFPAMCNLEITQRETKLGYPREIFITKEWTEKIERFYNLKLAIVDQYVTEEGKEYGDAVKLRDTIKKDAIVWSKWGIGKPTLRQ
jgi:hypothetical protein